MRNSLWLTTTQHFQQGQAFVNSPARKMWKRDLTNEKQKKERTTIKYNGVQTRLIDKQKQQIFE